MAKTTKVPAKSRNKGAVTHGGSFTFQGAAAPNKLSDGTFTITRTSAGLYVLTLDDRYAAVFDVGVNVLLLGWGAKITAITLQNAAGNTSFAVTTYQISAPSTPADPTAGTVGLFFAAMKEGAAV